MRKGLKRWLTMKPTKEEQIHGSINKYLDLFLDEKVVKTTVENSNQQGGKCGMIKQVKLKAIGVRTGWPDIQLLWNDGHLRMLAIEVKVPGKYLSPNQKEVHSDLKAIGAYTSVSRSIGDTEKILKEYNVPVKSIFWNTQ